MYADTCDPTWQSSRNGLIISAHVFSDISLLIFVAAGIYLVVDCTSKGYLNMYLGLRGVLHTRPMNESQE